MKLTVERKVIMMILALACSYGTALSKASTYNIWCPYEAYRSLRCKHRLEYNRTKGTALLEHTDCHRRPTAQLSAPTASKHLLGLTANGISGDVDWVEGTRYQSQ